MKKYNFGSDPIYNTQISQQMNAGEIAVIAWGMVGFVGIIVFALVVVKKQVDIKIHGAPKEPEAPEAPEAPDLDEPNDVVDDAPLRNPH